MALFTAIVLLARRDFIGDKRAELGAVMRSYTPPSDLSFDLEEFRSAHPELSASVYDGNGNFVGSVGRYPPAPTSGFREIGDRLCLGQTFRGQRVQISLDLRDTHRAVSLLTATLVLIWFPLTFLIAGITWAAAQSVFRPLERLSTQALAMSGSNLAERLVTPDSAEFGAFAASLNQMLDRIEETVRRGERFSADAAHELRTPLAILRTRLETALLKPRDRDHYRSTIHRSIEEITRLTTVIEALLRSARGELSVASSIDLEGVVTEATGLWRERFAARSVRLQVETKPVAATILPDEVRVVMDNLLDNALRYSPVGGSVLVSLSMKAGHALLLVKDEGAGVPAELGEQIFGRFVRADDSRNRDSGGIGIGLAVCRQIIVGRGGSMTLDSQPADGAAIGFRLPICPMQENQF